MNQSNEYDLTSGEGSILIEIVSDALPITPDVLRRPRIRPNRPTAPLPADPSSEQSSEAAGAGE